MSKILPILSGSLLEIINGVITKYEDPIAIEIKRVNTLVEDFNKIESYINSSTVQVLLEGLANSITDEVRMLSIRIGQFEVSFLPKDKEPEYGPSGTWSRKNRQTGKPAKIFQKLLKKEFKTREWEIFTNEFKAELCDCCDFEIVSGEDIRYWYLEDHYYKCDGTLGNSCMRYSSAQSYFDIYVDNAKMLITTKEGLLTGRAIVWEIDGKTILDRIYTCYDYLENCFIDYAKSKGWWIRETNSLLNTGDVQYWYTPDDNYTNPVSTPFYLKLDHAYSEFPYMDSFRYYDNDRLLCTAPEFNVYLDSTDGSVESCTWVCDCCGDTFYGTDDDCPEELHYSDYSDRYLCDNCCWYSDGLQDYIPNSDDCIWVHCKYGVESYPESWVNDYLVLTPDGEENKDKIVIINSEYYFISDKIVFNENTKQYEVRPNTN